MNFDVYAFSDICLQVIPIVIVLTLFVSVFLGTLAKRSATGAQIATLFSVLFCVGVIIHELAHQLMCKVFGVGIREIQYFGVSRTRIAGREYTNIGGHVDCEDVPSIIAGIALGIAPLLLNGILVALIYYYWPLLGETSYYGLFAYLGIALALGARPSKEDLAVWWHAFQKSPGRNLWEVLLLCILGGSLYYLVSANVELWIICSALITFSVICVIQGRIKSGASHKGSIDP